MHPGHAQGSGPRLARPCSRGCRESRNKPIMSWQALGEVAKLIANPARQREAIRAKWRVPGGKNLHLSQRARAMVLDLRIEEGKGIYEERKDYLQTRGGCRERHNGERRDDHICAFPPFDAMWTAILLKMPWKQRDKIKGSSLWTVIQTLSNSKFYLLHKVFLPPITAVPVMLQRISNVNCSRYLRPESRRRNQLNTSFKKQVYLWLCLFFI